MREGNKLDLRHVEMEMPVRPPPPTVPRPGRKRFASQRQVQEKDQSWRKSPKDPTESHHHQRRKVETTAWPPRPNPEATGW